MSSNKDVLKKTKSSTSNTKNGSIKRIEKEKTTDLRKIKKEETNVSAKPLKKDTDLKTDAKSVSNNLLVKRTANKTSSSSSTMKTKTKTVDTPSKRIVKSQYFPSKNMYSNVVKEKLKTGNNSGESKHTKSEKETKTIKRKSNEIRKSKTDSSLDQSLERPKTATLRKGSIVNANIVGPDVPKSSKSNEENVYDYEDDFDSYESDFEEYKTSSSSSSASSSISDIQSVESYTTTNSSSDLDSTTAHKNNLIDEERKLDSGNFELNSESKHKQLLDNIKESVERENAVLSNLNSLSDEGFEDGKSIQSENKNFINFLDAQKKCIRRKSLAQKKKRGEELLNMIKLDSQNFTLLEMPAITYEEYIKIYGNKSGHQVSSQTGEDNVNEEVQTDLQEITSKWTQFPVVISKSDNFNKEIYKMELNGVGTDLIPSKKLNDDIAFNYENLSRFLNSVEDVITQLVRSNSNEDVISKGKTTLPFSDGCLPIRIDNLPFLKHTIIKYVTFSHVDETKFLTVHNSIDEEYKSVICIWNIIDPKIPDKFLTCYGEITCSSFGLDNHRIIFGAFVEGSIAIWTLDECAELKYEMNDFILTKPNFITEISYGHIAKIVSIQPLIDNNEEISKNIGFELKSSSQICSLDEEGVIIKWSVILKIDSHKKSKNVSLIQNSKVILADIYTNLKNLQCTDMTINLLDLNHLFISTNYGYILHYLASGAKSTPKKYVTNEISLSNCITTCPFSPIYFLSGQENGKIILYSRNVEKQLKELSSLENDLKIQMIQWSYNKPFIFYSKDNKNNLHVWDLATSDLYPTHSIKYQDNINFIRLSPTKCKENALNRAYMVIVTDNSKIDLHILNKEHGPQPYEIYQEEVKIFLNYINRF